MSESVHPVNLDKDVEIKTAADNTAHNDNKVDNNNNKDIPDNLYATDLKSGEEIGITEKPYTNEEIAALEQFRIKLNEIIKNKLNDAANNVNTNNYNFPKDMPIQLTRHWSNCLDENDKQNIDCFDENGNKLNNWKELNTNPSLIPFKKHWPNWVIIRFLRARKLNIDKSIDLFWNYLNYRSYFGVDHLISYEYMPSWDLLKALVYHSYHKTDKIGRPTYYEKTGLINVQDFMYWVSFDKVCYTHIWMMHRMERLCEVSSKNLGRRIDQIVSIMDFKGFHLAFLKTVKFFKMTSYIDQYFFPEMLGCLMLVNAPATFASVWTLVKPFLAAETQAKMKIWGTNYQAKLIEEIGIDYIPCEYGGKCKCEPNGCIEPLKPFPNYLKAPEDLILVSVKAGKKHIVEFPLSNNIHDTNTTTTNTTTNTNNNTDKDEFEVAAEKLNFTEEEKKEQSTVQPQYHISWQIEAQQKDILTEIIFESNNNNNNNNVTMLNKVKVHSDCPFITGNYILPHDSIGTVKLIFDNSYSYFTGKDVKYKLTIQKQL